MGTELSKDAKYKFSSGDKSALKVNFRNKKIFEECLEEVNKLDKVLYSARKCPKEIMR